MNELQTMATALPTELTDEALDQEIFELASGLEEAENRLKPYYIRFGELLIEKKKRLPHGQFIPWIEKHCPFGRKTANQYMRIASSNVTHGLHLKHAPSQRQALEMIKDEPKEEFETPLTEVSRRSTVPSEINKFLVKLDDIRNETTEDNKDAVVVLLGRVAEKCQQVMASLSSSRTHLRVINNGD